MKYFTVEIVSNNSLPFLEVLVNKNNNRLISTVYRKPIHTVRYLNYESELSKLYAFIKE